MRRSFFDFVGDDTMRRTKKVLFLVERPGLYAAKVELTRYFHPQLTLLVQKVSPERRLKALDEIYAMRHEITEATQALLVVPQSAPLGIRATCPLPLRPLQSGDPSISRENGRLWVMNAYRTLGVSIAAILGVSDLSGGRSVEALLEEVVNEPHGNPLVQPRASDAMKQLTATATITIPTPQTSQTEPFAVPSGAGNAPSLQCPVCALPLLTPGRSRHQQCETRANAQEARDEQPEASPAPMVAYRRLVAKVEEREWSVHGQRREATSRDPVRLPAARQAVLLRCLGRCENPKCGGQPLDVTDEGQPILEVDHVQRITERGRDHPSQMIALCPNCHAMKERGRNRKILQAALANTAKRQHALWVKSSTTSHATSCES